MKIREFGVEMWMNKYETWTDCNLAETCVESVTVEQLISMCGNKEEILDNILKTKMTYGDIEGSVRLRTAIASLYKTVTPERVSVMHGAIGANALTLMGLLEKGDKVVTVVPTYQQHYSIPESIGCEVSLCHLKKENKWQPDIAELAALVKEDTKLICINNPNNPTGALMDEATLKAIVEIAKKVGAYILCDEAYRGINHEGDSFTASIADLYEKGIATGTMSKPFSLAGLRVGWVAAPSEIITMLSKMRDYHVISVGRIDDYLAALAIENSQKLIDRSLEICKKNIEVLDKWVESEPHISYVRPQSGTVTLLEYDIDMKADLLCDTLQKETGVMLLPGTCFDMDGYLRIGFGNNTSDMERGLAIFSKWLKSKA